MILKRIFIAIYLKSVFLPYDSNIKFYNATVLKKLKPAINQKFRKFSLEIIILLCVFASHNVYFSSSNIQNTSNPCSTRLKNL